MGSPGSDSRAAGGKIGGESASDAVLTDLVRETRSVKKAIWYRFL